MSTRTPTPQDEEIARPWIEGGYASVEADRGTFFARRAYWHDVETALRRQHPDYSARDVQRVARILAPFPLRERYADH